MSEDKKTAASIEETNALRLAAGLKPLGKDSRTKAREQAKQHEEAARVAQQEAQAAALQAQLARAKNKRLLTAKVVKGQSLGEQLEGEADDALAFVRRQKKAAARRKKEKALAQKRARELEEQEAQAAAVAYTGRDLRGLAVQHDAEAFEAGETRILTLADRGILDEEGGELNDESDMLVDVELAAREQREQRAADAVRQRYDVYAAAEAAGGTQALLAQYDDAERAPGLVLDANGAFDAARKAREARVAEQLDARRNGRVLYDLELLSNPVIASDTRSAADAATAAFKKPRRRKKKKRPKTRNTAQLLAELAPDDETGTGDHGSRSAIKEVNMIEGDEAAAAAAGNAHKDAYSAAVSKAETKARKRMASEAFGDDEDEDDEDAIDAELYSAVARARRTTAKKLRKTDVAADVLARRKALEEKQAEHKEEGVVFSDTTQFISTLDAVANERTEADEQKKAKQEIKREREEREGIVPDQEEHVASTSTTKNTVKSEVSAQVALGDEQPVSMGMGAALQHIRQRGMLDKDDEFVVGRRTDERIKWEELNKIDERQMRDQRDLQRLKRRGPRDNRPESETRQYDINLVYKDDQGRVMSQKEAFRYISYKFHGITPSDRKRDKYLKRDEEMLKARKMTSTEQATQRLKAAQQRTQKAGIVLPK